MHTDTDFTNPPGRRIGGLALICDWNDKVLLVEKTYREGPARWGLVGGSAHQGEPASVACQREVREETGLHLVPGALLAVHHMPASAENAEGINFVFECPQYQPNERLVLPSDELASYRWTARDELDGMVAPYQAWRIHAALAARGTGRTPYLVGHPQHGARP